MVFHGEVGGTRDCILAIRDESCPFSIVERSICRPAPECYSMDIGCYTCGLDQARVLVGYENQAPEF